MSRPLVRVPKTPDDRAVARARRDDLTVAYITMGVLQAIAITGGRLGDEIGDTYSGELGFVHEVIQHALMLDQEAD